MYSPVCSLRAMRDPMGGVELEKLSYAQRLIDAGLACGEAGGLLDNSYLRNAHQRRQRLLEAASSATLDGRPTSPERLYAFLADAPQPAQKHFTGDGQAAEFFCALSHPAAFPLGREATDLARQARKAAGPDVCGIAAELFTRREGNTALARLALALALRPILGAGEPAISPALHGLQAALGRSKSALDDFMATALNRAALRARDNARALRASVVTSLTALSHDRSSSRIHAIAALLFAGRPLSYAAAGERFKISRTATVGHFARLESLNLIEDVSGRRYGQVFAARDGVMTFAAPAPASPKRRERQLKVGLPAALTADQRARLDSAADQVAADMAELDRVLGALNMKQIQ